MAYSFNALDLKKIESATFLLPPTPSGEKWVGRVEPRMKDLSWPRAGSEAICALASVSNAVRKREYKSVLKIFRYAFPERARRQSFLVKQGFSRDYDWLFQCVPYSSFYQNFKIGGAQVIGHLSRYVGGSYASGAEDFDRLKQNGTFSRFSGPERRRFVGHLATAVAVLEAKGIAHGDLSDGNVLISPGPVPDQPVLVLCDFDGYHHVSVPKLPRHKRPLGTEGYVPPFLVERIIADEAKADDSICVSSDRFGLAVLACELMAWSSQVGSELGDRTRLFTNEALHEVRCGSWSIPDKIRSTWSGGFNLLQRALAANDWAEMPSPHEWLRAVGVSASVEGLPFVNEPFLRFRPARQRSYGAWRRARLTSSVGTLGRLAGDLSKVEFRFVDRRLVLTIPADETVLVGAIGRAKRRIVGPCELKISPDMDLLVAGWTIEIYDSVMPSKGAST